MSISSNGIYAEVHNVLEDREIRKRYIRKMAMKKQASLLSFFTRSPTSKNALKAEPIGNQTSSILKRTTPSKISETQKDINVANDIQTEEDITKMVSSDSEDDADEAMDVKNSEENVKQSPRHKSVRSGLLSQLKSSDPKHASSKISLVNESIPSKPVASEMAVSFINSFRATEQDLSVTSSKISRSTDSDLLDESSNSAVSDIESVRFPHLDFDFLQPENIRDAERRLSSHPDYCPRTLYVPDTFMKKQTPVGKFYEMYHMDAVIGVENLNLNYMRGSFAHCGFPEVAYGRFADQLVNRGYKVARVEQTETPTQLENRNKIEKANNKVVRREVCNITTPGTRTYGVLDGNDEQSTVDLIDTTARYLYAIVERGTENVEYGVCFIDTSVGRFYIGRLSDSGSRSALRTLFSHYQPAQILYERGRVSTSTVTVYNSTVSAVPKEALIPKKEFLTSENTLKLLASDKYYGELYDKWPIVLLDMIDRDSLVLRCKPMYDACISALGAVIWYLQRCFVDVDMISMRRFELYRPMNLTRSISQDKDESKVDEQYWSGRRLILDNLALKHLNIIPPVGSMKKFTLHDPITAKYTLYNVINKCATPAGKRLLRQWVCAPVCDRDILCSRQDAIEWLLEAGLKGFVVKAMERLRKVPDLERLVQKIHTLGLKYRAEEHPDSRAQMFETMRYNKRKIRDLVQALEGFERVHDLHLEFIESFSENQEAVPSLLERCFGHRFPDISNDLEHFKNAFNRDKAQEEGIIVPEKGIIKEYDDAICNVKECIHELDLYLNVIRKQLHCSNINFLGSGRSRYQLEIPEAIAMNLGPEFELKSSRKGYKRMVTDELVELVKNLDEAENELDIIRRDIMRRVFADFGDRSTKWTVVIERMATFDVLLSLTRYSHDCGLNMCRPQFIYDSKRPVLEIKSGYHPSLAAIAALSGSFTYIPNSVLLGGNEPSTILLTGPNMGGKSTLMRQVGVLIVLAQIGSFVPANEMKLSPIDRIFTRMGAGDRIIAGQSTFYVELYETNLILQNATRHSLVIIDELGRGTSTYDGTAIAYAVLLDVATRLHCRAFFPLIITVCVEQLKILAALKQHIWLACIVENENSEDPTMENVTFLYTLADGMCPKSYGFFAAKISGLRNEVIRAAFAASQRLDAGKTRDERMAELRKLAMKGNAAQHNLGKIFRDRSVFMLQVCRSRSDDNDMNYTGVLLGRGFSFWEKNGSIMLPGDINVQWKDYREIVQPDKASFWVMLGSLLLFIVWIIFITYYMSRVIGPIVAFLLTRIAHLKGNISRLHVSLNGLQVHIYNRLSNYRSLARYFGLEKLFLPLKVDTDVNRVRRFSTGKELEWDKYYDNLWSLIGYIKLDISSGRLVAGNALLPSMIVSSFENYTSEVSLKEYGKGDDVALLSIIGGTENVRVTLPLNYIGRYDPPPRTMGDGFAIVQTAHLNFFYSQSIPGIVKEGQQSLTEDLPIWESVWRFDKNTVFSYGPWADAQRVLLYDFFFPPEYRNSEVTVIPKVGERRILLSHDMRISLWNDAAIDIWFMRGDELNALHLRVKQGSSVDDLLDEWTSDSSMDLFKFVPYTWEFEINVMDSFELTLLLNEHNWIDANSSVSAENHLAALVGENVTMSFALSFLDFCPETITTVYEIKVQGMVALRTWLPPKSPLYSVLHSLLKYASFTAASSTLEDLSAVSHLAQDWVELFRTETITLLFEYTNHPLYYDPPSDLPLNLFKSTAKKQTAPTALPPDQLSLEIAIDDSEIVLIGLIIRFIIDLKNNYFGLYNQLTDVGKINSDTPSNLLYGNIISSKYERYRPLLLRLHLCFGKIKGFCLIHNSKMNSTMGSCPEIEVDEIVLEIVKDVHGAMVQVVSGIASLKCKPSSECPNAADGLLLLETFSFRSQFLYSDLDVPWDAAVLEYGWLMEISVGQLFGRLHSSQIVMLAQCIESLALLAACFDDKLLIPEKYDFCIHMNDPRTCPYAALNLVHGKAPIQNCESEENLEYRSLRVSIEQVNVSVMEEQSAFQFELSPIRLAHCSCHNGSFRSNILVKLALVHLKQFVLVLEKDTEKWIECGSICLNDISFDISLPYEISKTHLFLDRKNFLNKHDKRTKRLYFLWDDANSCACFGHTWFFGPIDTFGLSLMRELDKSFIWCSNTSQKNTQSAIGQSIIDEGRWIINMKNLRMHKETISERKASSNDSFHSAFSSTDVNVYHHMVGPILSSAILYESYASFLSVYENEITNDSNSKLLKSGFFERRKAKAEKNVAIAEIPLDANLSDLHTMNINGVLGSQLHIFITPLALEVTQRIMEQIFAEFRLINPVFIVQHLYTLCTFRHHSQPLTNASKSESNFYEAALASEVTHFIALCTSISINIFVLLTSHQLFLDNKKISRICEDSVSRLARNSVIVLRFHNSVLFLSSNDSHRKKSLPGMEFTLKGHAQFLQLVESWKLDFAYNKSFSLKYYTNWNQLNLNSRFSGYDLRVVIDAELPDLTLKVNSGELNSKLHASAAQDQLSLIIGPCGLTVGLCKPIGQTTRMAFFDVFAPCITSWIYAIDRLSKSLTKNIATADEWIDFGLIKLLLEVMDCNNSQAAASCPSCMLAIILLRYATQEDLSDYWHQMDCLEMKHYLNKTRRKQALIALLSHWQTIICSQVKISNVELAHKYLKHHLKSAKSSNEVRITVDSNQLNSAIDKNSGNSSTRSTVESHQMDLYHWVLARHREHKEASVRNRTTKKLLDDAPVNAMEIALSAFFGARRLESPKTNILLPITNTDAKFLVELISIKIDILEPKMISASNVSYLSTTRHHLLHLDSLDMMGQIHTELRFDELKLKPIRTSIFLSYNSSVQNIRTVFPFVAVCLFNDLSRVTRSCTSAFARLKTVSACEASEETIYISQSPSNFLTSEFDISSTCWLHSVIDKLRDYLGSRTSTTQFREELLEMKVDGNVDIKIAVLEMTLTHLYISATLKRTRLEHINRRDKMKDNKILDELNASIQRANLILSEFVVGHDAKHIVSFLVKTSSLRFEREKCIKGSVKNHIKVLIGDVEGDTPIHAQNLHEVVLRNVSQLNEQMTRLEYNAPTPVGEYSAHLQQRQGVVVINFELVISSIELSAQLLPSLKVKYRLDQAQSCGNTGSASKFTGRIKSHVVHFTVIAPIDEKRTSSLNSDTFTLVLPHISADGAYRMPEKIEHIDEMADENLLFREGGYMDVILTIGKLEHVFTTDLLNQILFAEQCFRTELISLIDRIIGDRSTRSPAPSEQISSQDPFLFTITLRGETAPWLQLTASTPTSIAVRLTFDNITAILTNPVIGVSTKLGLLVKTAMFEEIETELQEFATFMTQITLQNKSSSVPSAYSYVVTVNRPILLIKSSAIDKAILLWLNYKNTYDFWHEERKKMLKSSRRLSLTSAHVSTPLNAETEMNVTLSLKVTNGIYVCMPLYSADLSENLSALLISLQSTDISVCAKKELACQATFHKFKVKFIDNFDDQALNDTWIENEPADPSRSNYFYFPQGTYQLVSRAAAASDPFENAKWTLSIKWQMCGMVIDLDQRIGKYALLLISTFSSLTSDVNDEDWEELASESSVVYDDDDEQDAEIDATGELGSLAQSEERIQWLERKMHEQSVLVTDLMQCGASEPAIEKERRTLRKLESAWFKQFRKSIIEKLKRNAIRQRKKLMDPKSTAKKNVLPGLQHGGLPRSSDRGSSSGRSSESNVVASTVDMNIDVQVSIESGLCTLRALGKSEESTGPVTKRSSARDLKLKVSQTNESIAITKLAIPSVDVRAYYTSLDTGQTHKQIPRHLQTTFSHKYGKSSPWRRPAFYLAVELASMPQESLITPHLADFLEQMFETIPENNVNSSLDLSNMDQNEMIDSDVSIVEMDTSVIPLDVLFHLTVQSSAIRFEGQQQRTAAADCLLKLPSLTLMASTRPYCEGELVVLLIQLESTSGKCMKFLEICGFSCVERSVEINPKKINVFIPIFCISFCLHMRYIARHLKGKIHDAECRTICVILFSPRSTAQDALLLTLDHLSILASRSKNSRLESDNKVQFVLTANIGSANFNYDMRRLAELISFPKPWYRHAIVRRLFIGDHSVKIPTYNTETSRMMSQAPSKILSNKLSSIGARNPKEKEWSAVVICGIEWKELNISAQMANTMGNTKLILREGVLHGYYQLESAVLSAYGGVISGEIAITSLHIVCENQTAALKPPRNCAKLELKEIQSRIEWMSRPIFIAKCEKPSVAFWMNGYPFLTMRARSVLKASVAVNITCSWSDLQLIITKVTSNGVGIGSSSIVNEASLKVVDKNSIDFTKYHHWQSVLDMLTDIQTRQKLLPIPKSCDGVTIVGGVLELSGQSLSLACMHGEMNASSWALFHMRQPTIIFEPEARYIFVSNNQDVGVSIAQRLNIRLGDVAYQHGDTECMAVVCRVQQSRGSMVRQMSSVLACLHHVIGDVLHGEGLMKISRFPALDAVLSTLQEQRIEADEELPIPEVHSSFICEFHDSVNVQTDFSAQVSFLPELINTYMKRQTKEEKAIDVNRDFRRFICERWVVDPKICFIDRFKWNPLLSMKSCIFDHRTTIPKALQRGLLDPCDAF
ncbi:DNA mismatch repair protein Msh6 [Dirofilaria immitis]|nr:DNA mismatch repair protein Msh6 [Dirofilaria immitis]